MGDQASNDLYIALERLYSEGRWTEVEDAAQPLLTAESGSLRARVLLLLGHTRLHGFKDPETAAEHYRNALAAEAEGVLVEIAQDGLNQCHRANSLVNDSQASEVPVRDAVANDAVASDALIYETPPPSPAVSTASSHAMPWLQDLGDEGESGISAASPEIPSPTAGGRSFQAFPAFVQAVQNPEISKQTSAEGLALGASAMPGEPGESFKPVDLVEMVELVQPVEPDKLAETSKKIATTISNHPSSQGLSPQGLSPQGLSPQASAELAQGLLRVVIRAN